jgi:hypothetical protein
MPLYNTLMRFLVIRIKSATSYYILVDNLSFYMQKVVGWTVGRFKRKEGREVARMHAI